jgi:hypothetical protein
MKQRLFAIVVGVVVAVAVDVVVNNFCIKHHRLQRKFMNKFVAKKLFLLQQILISAKMHSMFVTLT